MAKKEGGALLRRPPAFFAAQAALLLLSMGAPAALYAQSSPSMSITLSPGHSVPQNTAITAAITLSKLDTSSYSSVIFRADPTIFDTNPTYRPAAIHCEGEDMGRDITVEVDESRETFTAKVYKACPDRIYVYYTLDASISIADTSSSSGKVELASTSTRFSMSRYLTPGKNASEPPTPDTGAWLEPDPTSFEWYAGEWVQLRARSNVLLYLNDYVGIRGYGDEPGHFVGAGSFQPSITVDEYCERENHRGLNFRRAIHQGLWVGACRPGDAVIVLWRETGGGGNLYEYTFRVRSRGENQAPGFNEGSSASRSVAEGAPSGQAVGAPIAASDNDGDALTYTLGGNDAGLFSIDSETGQIKVGAGTRLDYETRTGYAVTVSVHDGKDDQGNTDATVDAAMNVSISIENIDEPGTVTLSSAQPKTGVELTARLTDPDNSVTGIRWQWAYSSDGSANWTDVDGAVSSAYTPVAANEGKYLRAAASYTDGHGGGKRASAAADHPTRPHRIISIADAPENLQATAGNAEATLRWDAPGDDGGADITGYEYRQKEHGKDFTAYTDIPDSGPGGANERRYTITGLANGLEYVFHVRAVNEHGGGPPDEATVTLLARVNTESEELPTRTALLGNYPNPFHQETTIRYALPQAGNARLAVYDLLGHEVAVLVDEPRAAGRYATRFDASDLPSGTYVYRLQAQDKILADMMTIIR